jgi:hypothetical protein
VCVLSNTELLEQLRRAGLSITRTPSIREIHWQHDVLDCRERRKQLEELKYDSDLPSSPPRHVSFGERMHGSAGYVNLPAGGAVDTREKIEQSGLSTARPSDYRYKLSFVDREIDVGESVEGSCVCPGNTRKRNE